MAPLMLDADAQTVQSEAGTFQSKRMDETHELSAQLSQTHLSMVSRINELEIQNYEILKNISDMKSLLQDFKQSYDRKVNSEKESDVLFRKIGILS